MTTVADQLEPPDPAAVGPPQSGASLLPPPTPATAPRPVSLQLPAPVALPAAVPEPATLPVAVLPAVPAPPGSDVGDRAAGAAPPDPDDVWKTSLADRLATRNVPVAHSRPGASLGFDAGPAAESSAPSTDADFVMPELVSMGPPTTALLIGRALFVVAALLVGIAARRSAGPGNGARGDSFWPVVASAGVFVVVGLIGLVYWSTVLAGNARRLKARTSTPSAVGWSWALPSAWAVLSALTYLRATVDGDFDPLPAVAALGFVALAAVPYARLQGLFRGLSRRPPVLWLSAFPLDLAAFGLVWWRLTSWPDPVAAGDWNHVRLTANIAFAAAAALTVNWLVFGWLAQRASSGVYERLGRIEARHRGDEQRPDWFATGLAAAPTPPPTAPRPLVDTRPLTGVVALFHILWGLTMIALAVVIVRVAIEYAGRPTIAAGTFLVDDSDLERVGAVGGTMIIVYVLTIVVHGVWSVLIAINARRVTVHAPNPGSFGLVFVPMPVLVVVGLLVGGDLGYWIVLAGLTLALFALIRANQMLMTLSSRLGGELRGFSTWTMLVAATYLIGVLQNLLVTRGEGRIGFLGAVTFAQGALIVLGGVVGLKAMQALETTLRTHRQARRVPVG